LNYNKVMSALRRNSPLIWRTPG